MSKIIFDFKAKTSKLMLSQLDIILILNWRRFATYMLKEKIYNRKKKIKSKSQNCKGKILETSHIFVLHY